MAEGKTFMEKTIRKCLTFSVAGSFLLIVLTGSIITRTTVSPSPTSTYILSVLDRPIHNNTRHEGKGQGLTNKSLEKGLVSGSLEIKLVHDHQVNQVEQDQPNIGHTEPANREWNGIKQPQPTVLPVPRLTRKPSILPLIGKLTTKSPIVLIPTTKVNKQSNRCGLLLRPPVPAQGDTDRVRWQPVSGGEKEYVISAFWDRRYNITNYSFIRVVGVSSTWNDKGGVRGLYCQVWTREDSVHRGRALWAPTLAYLNKEHHNKQ